MTGGTSPCAPMKNAGGTFTVRPWRLEPRGLEDRGAALAVDDVAGSRRPMEVPTLQDMKMTSC